MRWRAQRRWTGHRAATHPRHKKHDNPSSEPTTPRHCSKERFPSPSRNGFIDVLSDNQRVIIPATLKEKFLKYLRKHHGIFTETIYNDIHGFIRNQNIQRNAYVQFYLGLTFQYKGYHAEPGAEKQQAYRDAISHYDQAIELNPED